MYEKVLGCLLGGLIGDAMGAPVEDMRYADIEKKYGLVDDFEGEGTDDSAIKLILCDGVNCLKKEWVDKVVQSPPEQKELASKLCEIVRRKALAQKECSIMVESLNNI
jgi:ADP-ribosylglycohydrolase